MKIGYEISFTRNFYKSQQMRPIEEIRIDVLQLERESEGMLAEIIGEWLIDYNSLQKAIGLSMAHTVERR